MAWSRRWHIASRGRWVTILQALLTMDVDFSRRPVELIAREVREEKTPAQRKLFHAVCADIAPHWGLPPASVKMKVKALFYGVELKGLDGVYYALVPSSEDSDKEEYSRLIDYAYQLAAESGLYLSDRRTH